MEGFATGNVNDCDGIVGKPDILSLCYICGRQDLEKVHLLGITDFSFRTAG